MIFVFSGFRVDKLVSDEKNSKSPLKTIILIVATFAISYLGLQKRSSSGMSPVIRFFIKSSKVSIGAGSSAVLTEAVISSDGTPSAGFDCI